MVGLDYNKFVPPGISGSGYALLSGRSFTYRATVTVQADLQLK